jgi:hypothetical protein
MAYATLNDLLLVEPTITEYGVLDWDAELARSETEINRVLKVRWYQAYQKSHITLNNVAFDPTLLTSSQLTQATVYHALAYHIAPKLTQFGGGEPDKFQVMMDYYSKRFEHEMDLVLREGVQYDIDNDNTVSASESASVTSLRLKR